MKRALLIIDPQNDFCSPDGALFVKSADEDMRRLSNWINKEIINFDTILVTQDCHQKLAVFHPEGFVDKDGNHPNPFTQISVQDLDDEIWIPTFEKAKVREYLTQLELQKRFKHTIWPPHCIENTWGMEVFEPIQKSLNNWEEKSNQKVTYILKGQNPLSEHYGAFKAEVDDSQSSASSLNETVLKELLNFDEIYLAGEAESHCVAMSLNQMCDYSELLASKVIVLTNCMSPVTGFETQGKEFFERAAQMGAKFIAIN